MENPSRRGTITSQPRKISWRSHLRLPKCSTGSVVAFDLLGACFLLRQHSWRTRIDWTLERVE